MRTLLVLLAGFSVLAAQVPRAPAKAGRNAMKKSAARRKAPPVFDPSAVNDPQWSGPQSVALLRAQILLARAHFSPGEIDGKPGDNFQRALSGYRKARGLADPGPLDEPTWAALNTDTGPVLKTYPIEEQDVVGPFQPVPEDIMEQAKLTTAGYSSAEEALSERFHVSPALLRFMNPKSKLEAGEQIQVPDTGIPAQGKAVRLVVTKAGTVTAYDAQNNVLAQYPCSSGSEHDPLPLGEWKVTRVVKDPPFYYDPKLFWDAKPSDAKAKVPPGPNNPVGLAWIDITKEHYGLHGTPIPARVGHSESHGCIRLTNWDVVELAGMVQRNVVVICQE